MSGQPKLIRPMWHLATLAAILGLVFSLLMVAATGAVGGSVFTGQRLRDTFVLSTICTPILQIALIVVGSIREESNPRMAVRLYALTLGLLFLLLSVPVFANLVF